LFNPLAKKNRVVYGRAVSFAVKLSYFYLVLLQSRICSIREPGALYRVLNESSLSFLQGSLLELFSTWSNAGDVDEDVQEDVV
jgi:hypothetical protein